MVDTEEGTVTSVAEGKTMVSVRSRQACATCGSAKLCHTTDGNLKTVEVLNPVNARPGDRVRITLPTGKVLKASAAVYLVPTAGLVGGAMAGAAAAATVLGSRWTQPGAAGGAVVLFFIALLWVRRFSRRAGVSREFLPSISEIIAEQESRENDDGPECCQHQ